MITIDKEFESLIPPLSPEEFAQLEQNCVNEGIRDPLVIWVTPSGNRILVDGHNRFKIAAKHSLEWKEVTKTFDDRDDVKAWILRNQLGRRNLPTYIKAQLALSLKPVIAEKAKRRMKAGKADPTQKSAEGETRDKLATIAGVSHDTIHKVEYIEQNASESDKELLRKGEASINKVYTALKKPKRVDPVEQAAKEHEDFRKTKDEEVVSIADASRDKVNRKILASDFYSHCLRTGKDIFEMYDQLKTEELKPEEFLPLLSDDQIRSLHGHFNNIIRYVTGISMRIVKE